MFLLDRLNHWASQTPDAPAVVFEGTKTSFTELRDQSDNLANFIARQYKIGAGDRLAYMGINHPNMLRLFFACAKLGAIFTPLNSRLASEEYAFLIADSTPKICVFDENFVTIAEKLAVGETEFVPSEELETVSASDPVDATPPHEDDPLLLVYTSGTTGRPKGVLLSHKAVAANIENCNALYDFKPSQNVLITLPLFHVGGLCILLLPALTNGATIYLHARFDPLASLRSIEEDKIITSIFVPAQMAAMMGVDEWHETDFSSLGYIVVGSSLIPKAQIQNWHKRNIPVSQIYGATETGPAAIGLTIDAAMTHEGSAGTVVKLCAIEIRDPEGAVCGNNENGEIWVRGPNILSHYWRNEAETKAVLRDGWYNTGDIGYRDDDGYFWIVDRSKDMIISGGENIYPAEVEFAAQQHPSIAAIAVVGRPDPHWGETPVAMVELHEEAALTQDELQEFLKAKIARYKQPKELIVLDALPRNGMGKIEKSVLRKMLAD